MDFAEQDGKLITDLQGLLVSVLVSVEEGSRTTVQKSLEEITGKISDMLVESKINKGFLCTCKTNLLVLEFKQTLMKYYHSMMGVDHSFEGVDDGSEEENING